MKSSTQLEPLPLEGRIRDLGDWFHNLNLNGIQTAPNHFLGDYPRCKYVNFSDAIPADLSGRSVLDIGCNAGFYSLEMKKRGADRVVGIDSDARYLAQAKLACDVLNIDIELRQMSVYEIGDLRESFDLVLFMGVLYHLRHPLLALDLIRQHACKEMLVFQSMQRGSNQSLEPEPDYPFSETGVFNRLEFPHLHFIENCYAEDPTNWWVPNRSCAEAMLRSSGFDITAHPEAEVYICRINSAAELHEIPTTSMR